VKWARRRGAEELVVKIKEEILERRVPSEPSLKKTLAISTYMIYI